MTGGQPALLIALPVDHGQELVHIPGIAAAPLPTTATAERAGAMPGTRG
ncbi:hypothetical protein [Streptomyces sp. NPDC058572]